MKNITTYILSAAVALGLSACASSEPEMKTFVRDVYVCEGGATVYVERLEDQMIELFYGRQPIMMQRVKSASGVKYINMPQVMVWWEKGNEAYLEIGGKVMMRYCLTKK